MKLFDKASLAVLSAALILSGCVAFGGVGLKPGTATESDVRQAMGEPAQVWPEAGGGKLLSYPRGPMGMQTYMVRIDSSGRLASINQVLDDRYFLGTVQRGMSKDDIGRVLGPPGEVVAFQRRNEIAWDYRYRDSWGYPSILSVIFGPEGTVNSTVSVREGPREGSRN